MTFGSEDLGDIEGLATAIGLVDGSGNFQEDWLTRPGDYLSNVLADETQRDSLIAFIDDALGGSLRRTDAAGRIWLPIVEETNPAITFFAVIDGSPPTHVRIGLGVSVRTTDPDSETSLHIPLFKAAKEGHSVGDVILLGTAEGFISFGSEIVVDSSAPVPGQAHLGRIGLSLEVPTAGSATPGITISLTSLQLPGAPAPRDLLIASDSLDTLDDAALDLVLGLIQAQAAGLPPGPLTGLAGMLGLNGGSAVPPLPIADLPSRGVDALTEWLNQVVSSNASRAAWFGELATLLGGSVSASADGVTFTLGAATVTLGVRVATGTAGASVITPLLSARIASGSIRAELEAELARIDLGDRSATALPRLSLIAHAGQTPAGGTPLLTGDPAVQALRLGVALNGARKPVAVLAADGVTIGSNSYATLDLSTPDALVESVGSVLADVVDDLIQQLGSVGETLRALLGLAPPAGHPTVPTLDFAAFLGDPLAALRSHWQTMLRDHRAAVPDLLDSLRGLLGDAGAAVTPISGTGTRADPWRLPLIGPVELRFHSEPAGDNLTVALACRFAVDTLGERCTRVETSLAVALGTLDLVAGSLVLAGEIEAQLTARARGETRARFAAGPIALSADHVGLAARWSAAAGLSVEALAPNPAAEIADEPVPIALPTFDADGTPTLDADGWDAVERLLGLLGTQSPLPSFRDLVEALGWIGSGPNLADDPAGSLRSRLRLADLATDPTAALQAWAQALLTERSTAIEDALSVVARLISGSAQDLGSLHGFGRPELPYRLPLFDDGVSPELAFWLEPHGPRRPTLTNVGDAVRNWRPGKEGLDSVLLAEALLDESALAKSIATLVDGRGDLAAGLDALLVRWVGTDGRIVPPAVDPAGVTVHPIGDVTAAGLEAAIDLDILLGGSADVRINIAVVAADAPLPWPSAPADRVIDLRAPGLAPESFALPTAAAGEWFVALAGRATAQLPADDNDGIAGQAARLQRILPVFGGLGRIALVASGGAGHAARRAAETVTDITDLVTLGTPAGPVAFSILDSAPAAEALRVLLALLPAADPAAPDDPDLAAGRALVSLLADLLPLGDPGVELRPPETPPPAPRAGLAVHGVFGVMSEARVQAALTAIVTAGLSDRAAERASIQVPEAIAGAGFGVSLPVSLSGDGLVLKAEATLETLGFDLAAPGGPAIRLDRALRIEISLARESGWLIGGPDPARGTGPRPDHELRRLEATVVLPLSGAGAASAEIVLIEPKVFGIGRERWVVNATGVASTAAEVVTPALPEVRVLLAQVALQLSAATAPAMVAMRQVMDGLGLLDSAGGMVADAIDHLLNEPAAHLADSLADATRRAALQSGLATATAPVAGLSFDLAGRTLNLTLAGVPGTIGLLPWSLSLTLQPDGPPQLSFALEGSASSPAGGLGVRVQTEPFSIVLQRHRPGLAAPQEVPLWPSPDADALLAAVTRLAPAELARLGLAYLRDLDETAQPIVETAYDAVGLLGPADPEGARPILLPLELIQDPVGWLGHAGALGGSGGIDPAKVIALFEAFKPILGVAGGPGEWAFASGVLLRADTAAGAARLSLELDSSGFAPIPTAAGRLVLSGTIGLSLPQGAPPQPSIDVALGLGGAAAGRQAVHVALNGGLRVFLRPDSGPDISLYPDPPGLGSLATAAVTQALPLILDALAAETGPGLAGDVGAAVRAVGDALALRSGTPASFDGAALQAWATDPAAAFAARLPALSTPAINALASALGPLLPAPAGASVVGNDLRVTVGGVSISLQPAPFQIAVGVSLTGLPAVQRLELSAQLDGGGLDSLLIELGPADIDAGGLTLRPYVATAAGEAPPGGRRVSVGLAFDAAGTRGVEGRWLTDGPTFTLLAMDGAVEDSDPAAVALALVEAVVQLLGAFALSTPAVDQLLDTAVLGSGNKDVRDVLQGVFLEDVASPGALDPLLFQELFQLDPMLARLKRLLVNIADAGPSVDIGGGLSIGVQKPDDIVELSLILNGRIELTSGEVAISLEADSRWIQGTPDAGLAFGFLNAATDQFAPSLAANGLGLRIGKTGGPLIDAGVTLGSVALHLFGRVSASELAGGAQIQLSDLGTGVAGASGGNPVAQGIVADSGSGKEKLAPAFSPALAVQKHGDGPILVSLRAGEGDGPWFLAIQKGFGPIYIEQVGLDTTVTQDQLVDISVLLDGRVSIAGLTAAVDDLKLTFVVASNASIFDPSRWSVDLAGLAVEADMGGVVLAGGLRKFGSGENVEYIGMLLARFAAYGLSVYGGYGTKVENGERFAAFFAFGAINGPLGGPPAFFLTGIGGGVGINRDLIFPSELDAFADFPFIRALDPAATPTGDPMAELISLRDTFPMKRGDFWFAAGLSFNSFALVDGIAVVAVKIGDGLEISLLGLARMALPRPQIPLVSIELGLIARFSTEEGVLWIQAQLTDNSWLLHESVRLTGGFAFVSWFDGERAGEFVVTMGGFHPSFHRDGYPVVPRLGFNWQVASAIVIKGENYFALTSEALMAGGKLEASARFGPAWAEVKFGADGIVYFDPFRFEVEVYARIAAGITIDVWIGEITISISLGARIQVQGPKFRGVATFEVGPVELTVAFGDTQKEPKVYLTWEAFVPKYLEEASPGVARCVTALPGKGALPPGTGPSGSESGTADGSAQKPFEVLSEFEISVTTTVPTRRLQIGNAAEQEHAPSRDIGLGPIGDASVDTTLVLSLLDGDGTDHLNALIAEVRRADGFPVGVWGNPQPDDDRKVPKGEVIEAVEGLRFEAVASIEDSLPQEMAYHQVEAGPRKPLPFVHSRVARPQVLADAGDLAATLPAVATVAEMYAAARPWLAIGGNGGTALAALERERSAPPRLGSLTEHLASEEPAPPEIELPDEAVRPPVDTHVYAPVAIAIMTAEIGQELPGLRTTVSEPGEALAEAPPRLSEIAATFDWAVPAKLVRLQGPAATGEQTLLSTGSVPFTRGGPAGVAAVGRRGASMAGQQRLDALSGALGGSPRTPSPDVAAARTRRGGARATKLPADPTLGPGEIAVLRLPNTERDVDSKAVRPRLAASGGPARLVALAAGGRILADALLGRRGAVVPRGTERLAVLAQGARGDKQAAPGLLGWHDAQSLPYLGWATALVAGGTLRAEGAPIRRGRQRFRAGWVPAAHLIDEAALIVTRFTEPLRTLVLVIDEPRNGAGAGRNLELGLDGAERALDKHGKPRPPALVAAGNRSLLVYALRPATEKDEGVVTVSVAREEGWRLAGVLASQQDAGTLAERLAAGGLDRLVQPLAVGRGGKVTLRWTGRARRRPTPPKPTSEPTRPGPSVKTRTTPASPSAKPPAEDKTTGAKPRRRKAPARKSPRSRERK